MEKSIADERTGLRYELVDDFCLISGRMNQRKNMSQSGYGAAEIVNATIIYA